MAVFQPDRVVEPVAQRAFWSSSVVAPWGKAPSRRLPVPEWDMQKRRVLAAPPRHWPAGVAEAYGGLPLAAVARDVPVGPLLR